MEQPKGILHTELVSLAGAVRALLAAVLAVLAYVYKLEGELVALLLACLIPFEALFTIILRIKTTPTAQSDYEKHRLIEAMATQRDLPPEATPKAPRNRPRRPPRP